MPKAKKTINLLPVSEFEKSVAGQIFSWFVKIGRYIVIGTELVVIVAFVSRFLLDKELTDLNESIKEKQAVISSYSDLESRVTFLQNRISAIARLDSQKLNGYKTLDSLAQLTPSDVYLDSLSLNNKKIEVEAVAGSDASLQIFLTTLQKSNTFSDINLSTLQSGGSTESLIHFAFDALAK
jgi:Tfp pilus assembly protein PilN